MKKKHKIYIVHTGRDEDNTISSKTDSLKLALAEVRRFLLKGMSLEVVVLES